MGAFAERGEFPLCAAALQRVQESGGLALRLCGERRDATVFLFRASRPNDWKSALFALEGLIADGWRPRKDLVLLRPGGSGAQRERLCRRVREEGAGAAVAVCLSLPALPEPCYAVCCAGVPGKDPLWPLARERARRLAENRLRMGRVPARLAVLAGPLLPLFLKEPARGELFRPTPALKTGLALALPQKKPVPCLGNSGDLRRFPGLPRLGLSAPESPAFYRAWFSIL